MDITDPATQPRDPLARLDVAADRLFGPRPAVTTPVGGLVITALRRASVLAAVEIFGTDEQRHAARRLTR